MEMAAPPGQCIALQAFNMLKEAISGYDNLFQKNERHLHYFFLTLTSMSVAFVLCWESDGKHIYFSDVIILCMHNFKTIKSY